jgi:hypothetical protein
MTLPYQPDLQVNRLAACFNNTVTPYKFYWFMAVISKVETGETVISKRDLFADMVAQCWYTVNYFHVSFGKQDKLQVAVEKIKAIENLTVDESRIKVCSRLSATQNLETIEELIHFDQQVPHRFLSPWFNAENRKTAYASSKDYTNQCLYALSDDHITINPEWVTYLQRNARLLKDFCFWNLAIYLQAKNPNVPDIPNKLVKLPVRKTLNKQRRDFWDVVINELGYVDCIYTNKRLTVNDYAVEHFVPYAFVSHDLIWNLIPADRSFNSSKSDKLIIKTVGRWINCYKC